MQFYLIFNGSILRVLIKLFCPTGKCNEKVWSIEHNVHQGQAVLPSYLYEDTFLICIKNFV